MIKLQPTQPDVTSAGFSILTVEELQNPFPASRLSCHTQKPVSIEGYVFDLEDTASPATQRDSRIEGSGSGGSIPHLSK